MQDLQIQENIIIKKTPLLQKYNTKQIQTLFIQFVENLEEKGDEEMEEPIILEQVDFENLTESEKQTVVDFRNNKDKMKFYNVRPENYGV